MDRADGERETVNAQAVSILKDPRILAAAMEANRRVLTPLWFELIEEGRRDGSIQTVVCERTFRTASPRQFLADALGVSCECGGDYA